MNLLSEAVFPAFLSLGRECPLVYWKYFRDVCGCENGDVDFAVRTKETVRKAVGSLITLIILEERALGSILQHDRYAVLIEFLRDFAAIESNGQIFDCSGTNGHILFLIQSLIELSETRCEELRSFVQRILSLILVHN
jgi:hypothetical protein